MFQAARRTAFSFSAAPVAGQYATLREFREQSERKYIVDTLKMALQQYRNRTKPYFLYDRDNTNTQMKWAMKLSLEPFLDKPSAPDPSISTRRGQ